MLSNEFTGVAICILILVFVSYFVVKISNNRIESFSLNEHNVLDNYFDMIVCICIPERKKSIIETFRKWGIKNVHFFDAFLKKDYSHEDFIKMGFLDKDYSSYLNVGRLCCHYSAMSVYKAFLNSNSKSLLVFEDDLRNDTYKNVSDFNRKITPIIQNIPKDWEYLNFSKCYDFCSKEESINEYWSIPNRPLCRTAIAMRRGAAEKIVQNTSKMKELPGDKMIGSLIQNKMFKAYSTKDITFFQHREVFGSNLENLAKTNPQKCANENILMKVL